MLLFSRPTTENDGDIVNSIPDPFSSSLASRRRWATVASCSSSFIAP